MRLGQVVSLVFLLVMSACSDPEPKADPGPDATDPTESSAAADPCVEVTEAELTEWTGAAVTVDKPDVDGEEVSCRAANDAEGLAMFIKWGFGPAAGSLESLTEAGLTKDATEPREVELAGDVRALESGTPVDSGHRTVTLTYVVGDRFGWVELNSNQAKTWTQMRLAELAGKIAETYTAGGASLP